MANMVFFKITGENRTVFDGEHFGRHVRICPGDDCEDWPIPGSFAATVKAWREAGATVPEMPHRFKVLDDDGVAYFWGVCSDDSSFAPLDDVGADYGATEIQYKDLTTGKYETL